MIPPNYIPPRFRESAFRRYENVIARILRAYPGRSTFRPQADFNLSPTTFSCRLRDAITGMRKYHWPSTIVDLRQLLATTDIVVSEQTDGNVVVGPRDALKLETGDALQTPEFPSDELVVTVTTDQERKLLCWLTANRALARPLRVFGIYEPQALEELFDVAIIPNKDETVTIM